MILSLNPGMSYSVEENNVSLGQIKKKKKKKKHFVSEEMWKKELCEMYFFYLFGWFGLVFLFCFCFVFVFVVVVVLVLMQNPQQPFSPLFSQFCFFLFVLFCFVFKNWENYCEQVSKNLEGGGEVMKSPV